MKKIVIIYILLFSITSYSQITKISYSMELVINESKTINKDRLEMKRTRNNALKNITADLIFDNISSKFSIPATMPSDNKSVIDAITYFDLDKPIYNHKGIKYEYGVESLSKEKKYFVSSESKLWKLHRDTIMVAGYRCYKATHTYSTGTDKKFTFEDIVWYCPEIKGSFGPDGLGNLPGAALIYQHADKIYKARIISFNSNEKINFPTDVKVISELEYDELWRKWEEAEFGN